MSILGKIIKTGVVAGAAYAAAKIGQKYKEKDPNGTAENKADVLKEAANEFYQTTAAAVKEKAPAVIETLQEKAQEAVSFAEIRDSLAELGKDMELSIRIQREEIFDAMHTI